MHAPNGSVVAGLCHARGEYAGLPPQWLAHVVAADLDASIERCQELGGAVVAGPRGDAPGMRHCVIRDPAGAVIALMDPGAAWRGPVRSPSPRRSVLPGLSAGISTASVAPAPKRYAAGATLAPTPPPSRSGRLRTSAARSR